MSIFPSIRTAVRAGVLAVVCLVGAGCVAGVEPPDVAKAAGQATGVEDAIRLDTAGGPVDVGSVAPADTLTMPQALRLALRVDPDLQAALARVRAAKVEAEQSRLLPNPVLSVALRFPQNAGTPYDISVTEEFLAILQRPGRVSAADDRLRAAAAEAISAVLDTFAEVQERYATIQSLDALMPVLDERRNLIARLVRLAQDRLDRGEGTRLDLTTLETQRLELEVEIAERRTERRQERLTLARLIGQSSGAPDWQVTPWDGQAGAPADEAAWVAAALDRRPEIEAQRWELAALGVEARLARFAPFESAEAGVGVEKESGWTAGPDLSIPLPLFDWGQAKTAKAQALRLEARHKLTKARRKVVEEVRKQFTEYADATATLELVRTQLLPAQQRRRSETEAAYRAGLTDITTLILADQDLQAGRAKLIDLQRRTAAALVRLHRAVGGPGVAARLTPTTAPAAATQHIPTTTLPTTRPTTTQTAD